MRGVDAVIARGYIDPKRLAVTGGSGGGLLTAWIIGHTDRFAAAVSQYPVTNWITQVGTADGGYQHAAVWMKAMPWENPEQYLSHSPIFFAANFKTPTMVITGEADLRTPMPESEELYFALKAKKVDAVLAGASPTSLTASAAPTPATALPRSSTSWDGLRSIPGRGSKDPQGVHRTGSIRIASPPDALRFSSSVVRASTGRVRIPTFVRVPALSSSS